MAQGTQAKNLRIDNQKSIKKQVSAAQLDKKSFTEGTGDVDEAFNNLQALTGYTDAETDIDTKRNSRERTLKQKNSDGFMDNLSGYNSTQGNENATMQSSVAQPCDQCSALQEKNEKNADFDAARLSVMQDAIDINTQDREDTYHMLGKLSEALKDYKGGEGKDGEGKYSGWLNKALDNGILSKTILAGGIAAVAVPALHSFNNGFDFSNFTAESGGEMLTALLILAALAGMVKILENYLKKDDKEVVQNLKANLQSGLTDLMNGKQVDIKKLDNMAKEITALCPNGKGFIAEYEQLKHHARHVDVKDSIMVGDSTAANPSLAKQGSKVEQKVMKGNESEINKIKNLITMSNTQGGIRSNNVNISNVNQQKNAVKQQ